MGGDLVAWRRLAAWAHVVMAPMQRWPAPLWHAAGGQSSTVGLMPPSDSEEEESSEEEGEEGKPKAAKPPRGQVRRGVGGRRWEAPAPKQQ